MNATEARERSLRNKAGAEQVKKHCEILRDCITKAADEGQFYCIIEEEALASKWLQIKRLLQNAGYRASSERKKGKPFTVKISW